MLTSLRRIANVWLVGIWWRFFFCSAAAQWGQWPPHLWGFSRSHTMTGLLWTSDQPVAETSTWQHTTLTTINIYAFGGIWTHDLSRRAAADLRLRPLGHWDQHMVMLILRNVSWALLYLGISSSAPKHGGEESCLMNFVLPWNLGFWNMLRPNSVAVRYVCALDTACEYACASL